MRIYEFDCLCWKAVRVSVTGDVTYVDQANATASKLAYVNDAGHAIIKVDDTSVVQYNYKRNSVCLFLPVLPIGQSLTLSLDSVGTSRCGSRLWITSRSALFSCSMLFTFHMAAR